MFIDTSKHHKILNSLTVRGTFISRLSISFIIIVNTYKINRHVKYDLPITLELVWKVRLKCKWQHNWLKTR
jgi:hypothetical protein